jgi:hypothetical protein
MPTDNNKLYTPEKTYLEQCDLDLIKAIVEDEMPFEKTSCFAIDSIAEHLVCIVDYDSEFHPDGYDYIKGPVEYWVRISVLHPRYSLFMANILVRMSDGLINIDEEIYSDVFHDPKIISKKLYAFLNGDLLPVIRSGAMKLTIDNINYRLHEQGV